MLKRNGWWSGCWGGLSCFNLGKGGKRIVPASRIPESSVTNGAQAVRANQAAGLPPSLLAPPSSPASFTNSALQSTAQSPTCVLSLPSPSNPSSTMFTTGPYAHETQLVSPPVFSTFTTEPSTAPLTPPSELAHFTTPSSPDVPFAQFLNTNRTGEQLCTSQDTNFFCPATYAQFYLDNPPFPRLSVSKESDSYPTNISTWGTKGSKQEADEIEAYRASFGFSADEIITTPSYVEISDGLEEPFTMTPLFIPSKAQEESMDPSCKGCMDEKQKGLRKGLSSSDTEVDYGRGSRNEQKR